jgi:NAD kinase
MWKQLPTIVIVTAPTRLQGLVARWGTKGQAKFRLTQAVYHSIQNNPAQSLTEQAVAEEAGFASYESESNNYQQVIQRLRNELDFGPPVTVIERQFLPNYDFRNAVVVVVVGHDGLVANTAKYVGGLPIIGVNPDPSRNDGVLLPVAVDECRRVVADTLKNQSRITQVSMASATLNDGQNILAFNDLFIGRRNHVSARYNINYANQAETQSSSGIIVATGAGSTGWLSSVFNMVRGVNQLFRQGDLAPQALSKSDKKLAWVVREPFASRHSQASMVIGFIDQNHELTVESLMPEGGVIFSDGIESDFLEFNSGATAKIQIASHQAQLVTP